MVVCYEIVSSEKQIEGYGHCRVFGLSAYEQENGFSNSACCIDDISADRRVVQKLYNLVKINEVHPVHLKDVVLDYIS